MAYEVVKAFHDLQDYKDDVGDTYPRQGLDPVPNKTRIEELLSSGNAQGVPLIAEVKEKANAGKA